MKSPLLVLVTSLVPSLACAASILSPGDFVLAVDTNPQSQSSYPEGESPANVLDQLGTTKYLNFGSANSGFIVTPASGSSIVRSVVMRTAGDEELRDPASFLLYGTNSTIASTDNSLGLAEAWTLIASSVLNLPAGRQQLGSPVNLGITTAYTSYRMVFNTLKSPGQLMQIADVQFFSAAGGLGTSILATGDSIVAIQTGSHGYPGGEAPANGIGGAPGKYLHFGGSGTGLIVKPAVGLTVIDSFQILTGDDTPARDPASYTIYGTNDIISSPDNTTGIGENWTLIQGGSLTLPDERSALDNVESVTNGTAYSAYKIVFNSLKDEGADGAMQIGDIQLFGTVVPEPGTVMLIAGSLVPLLSRRRRR